MIENVQDLHTPGGGGSSFSPDTTSPSRRVWGIILVSFPPCASDRHMTAGHAVISLPCSHIGVGTLHLLILGQRVRSIVIPLVYMTLQVEPYALRSIRSKVSPVLETLEATLHGFPLERGREAAIGPALAPDDVHEALETDGIRVAGVDHVNEQLMPVQVTRATHLNSEQEHKQSYNVVGWRRTERRRTNRQGFHQAQHTLIIIHNDSINPQ